MTLIEVLVALLVIGIGLLGLAGLQTTSMQYNHSSYMRTHANNMAYDMADRMRANRQAALDGAYNLALDDPAPGAGGASIVDQDLAQWYASLQTTLPNAAGGVAVSNNGDTEILIRWIDDRGEEGAEARTFRLTTRL